MNLRILIFLGLNLASNFLYGLNEEPIRTWTSSDGRTLEARFIEQVGSNVRIKNEAGREFTLPITRFSQADQEYVQDRAGMLMEPMRRDSRTFYQKDEQWDGYRNGGVLITALSGKVETKAPPPKAFDPYEQVKDSTWLKPEVGQVLVVGHLLRSGEDGNVSLLLTNGTVIGIQPNTLFSIRTFFQDDVEEINANETFKEMSAELSPSMIKFKLEKGEMVVETKKLDKKSSFFLETQVGVAGIRGTAFRLRAKAESQNLEVLRGQVDLIGKNGKLTSVINGQETSMTREQTETPVILSTENKALLQKICSEIEDSAAIKTMGDLIKVREEANPPLTLIPDERGVEEALRERIRRPRGRILPVDYQRVGSLRLHYNNLKNKGEEIDFKILEKFPNLEKLEISDYIKFSSLNLNSLDNLKKMSFNTDGSFFRLQNLFQLRSLEYLTCRKSTLGFFTKNKELKTLNIIYGGRILDNLKNGKEIEKKDAVANISQLTNFPKLETLTIEWNKDYDFQDFLILNSLKELKLISFTDRFNDLSSKNINELKSLLPNIELSIINR
jgi:hypothetical protein